MLDGNWFISDSSFEDSVLSFDWEWKISWKAICNNIFWSYTLSNGWINISWIWMTRKACKPDSFSEKKITDTLENIDNYKIDRDVLILSSKDWKYKITYSAIK